MNWQTWLQQFSDHKQVRLSLKECLPVAEQLDLVNWPIPVVMVAGTNGKGSCCALLEQYYTRLGCKVGVYSSPHVYEFNERIRYINHNISNQELATTCEDFNNLITSAVLASLSYFEILTLLALSYFKTKLQAQALDLLILEIGLGGRLDAVNLVNNNIGILTSVALDHCNYLGPDIYSIAAEKIAIARTQQDMIIAEPKCWHDEKLQKQLADYLAKLECRAHWVRGGDVQQKYKLPTWPCGLPNSNLAAALQACELLAKRFGLASLDCASMAKTILNFQLQGRFNVLTKTRPELKADAEPTYILDMAHNPAASQWLLERYLSWRESKLMPAATTQKAIQQPLRLELNIITAVARDKDFPAMLTPWIQAWQQNQLPELNTWWLVDLADPKIDPGNRLLSSVEMAALVSQTKLQLQDNCKINFKTGSLNQALTAPASTASASTTEAGTAAVPASTATHGPSTQIFLIFGSVMTIQAAHLYLCNN